MHKTPAMLLFIATLLAAPAVLLAAPEQITVTHTYYLGDSESRNEARASCLAEAKRKIAEQAGAYVEILSMTRNFQMDRDAVLSFTAALVSVTVEEERFEMDDQSLSLTLTVTGEVDPEVVKRRMDELAQRRLAREGQGSMLQEIDAPAPHASKEPGTASEPSVQERAAIAESSEPRTATPARAASPRDAKARLARSLEETTRLCVELAEPGMTRGEVEHLLGEPRAVKNNSRYSYTGAKYGHLWVVFRDDVVACVRSRLEYRRNAGGEAHCEGFATSFVRR